MDNDNPLVDNKKPADPGKPAQPSNAAERVYGAGYKLIGENYTTPDLIAKVTGRAKYAEDFRADGMLFCKLLLSPMPHARVRKIHPGPALPMPGAGAILTADDLPKAALTGIPALTNEPLF